MRFELKISSTNIERHIIIFNESQFVRRYASMSLKCLFCKFIILHAWYNNITLFDVFDYLLVFNKCVHLVYGIRATISFFFLLSYKYYVIYLVFSKLLCSL